MGHEVRQDLVLLVPIILELLTLLDREWVKGVGVTREQVTLIGAYSAIAFCGSFWGHEVCLVDLHGLIKYASKDLVEGGNKYALIPLLGRFKNEDGEHYHLTPLAWVTNSGLQVGLWVGRLVELKIAQGLQRGPAFSIRQGQPLDTRCLELEILDRLHTIQGERPDLISEDVNVHEDYRISRSFR
jgi:hypothetical protein